MVTTSPLFPSEMGLNVYSQHGGIGAHLVQVSRFGGAVQRFVVQGSFNV